MQHAKNKIIKRYLQEIRHLLPVCRKEEKRYLADLKREVEEYAEAVDTLSMEMLIQAFGEPKDLASNYILEQDAAVLRKSMRFSRYIRNAAVAVVLMAFAAFVSFQYALYQDRQAAHESYITREVIEIREGEEVDLEEGEDVEVEEEKDMEMEEGKEIQE